MLSSISFGGGAIAVLIGYFWLSNLKKVWIPWEDGQRHTVTYSDGSKRETSGRMVQVGNPIFPIVLLFVGVYLVGFGFWLSLR